MTADTDISSPHTSASSELQHRLGLFPTLGKLRRLVTKDQLQDSLTGSASWLHTATETALGTGVGHRMAVYSTGGDLTWLYPHSNTGEVMSAWLDLASLLHRPHYVDRACEYADGLLDDPVRGIYRGSETEAHGLAWYWTDGGSYSGLYSMRMPFHFIRLHGVTGRSRYLEICDVIGRMLLRRQLNSGLVDACWSPEKRWAEGGARIGCRFIYSMATFACLWKVTSDNAYRDAYESSVTALVKMQAPDGSFRQHYVVETAEPHPTEHSIKPFFYGYLLNAIAEAFEVFSDARILKVARNLGDHIAATYYYRHALPYCTGDMPPSDQTEADAFVADSANGLLWLAARTGEPVYRDIGIKLWLDAYVNQVDAPARPGWHGAIIQGSNPSLRNTLEGVPANRLHLRHDPKKLGKCSLWAVVNHIFATKRLLENFVIE